MVSIECDVGGGAGDTCVDMKKKERNCKFARSFVLSVSAKALVGWAANLRGENFWSVPVAEWVNSRPHTGPAFISDIRLRTICIPSIRELDRNFDILHMTTNSSPHDPGDSCNRKCTANMFGSSKASYKGK